MSSAIFYIDILPKAGELAIINEKEAIYALNIRRIRVGEYIHLGNGTGTLCFCIVEKSNKNSLTVRALQLISISPPKLKIKVVQAIPKSDNSGLAVQLATEAGADIISAWQASRCVSIWQGSKINKGLKRWKDVAISASKQSRRAYIPEIEGLISTTKLIKQVSNSTSNGSIVLVLHELAAMSLASQKLDKFNSIVIIVGPEGGISNGEMTMLAKAGAKAVRLGPNILRTSTAAAIALGAIGASTERWNI